MVNSFSPTVVNYTHSLKPGECRTEDEKSTGATEPTAKKIDVGRFNATLYRPRQKLPLREPSTSRRETLLQPLSGSAK
jgi:hypothetical protein